MDTWISVFPLLFYYLKAFKYHSHLLNDVTAKDLFHVTTKTKCYNSVISEKGHKLHILVIVFFDGIANSLSILAL